jgi:hypothetical protein
MSDMARGTVVDVWSAAIEGGDVPEPWGALDAVAALASVGRAVAAAIARADKEKADIGVFRVRYSERADAAALARCNAKAVPQLSCRNGDREQENMRKQA